MERERGACGRSAGEDEMAIELQAPGTPQIQPTLDLGTGCRQCGQPNPVGVKFCGECGAPLRARCERKQVTVVFTDVCGFTGMSERLDPEDVREIIDRAFEIILDTVHRHEGTINQFLGDGVMALFGASTAHDDDPYRAVRTALAIQADLESLRAEVQHAHGVDFRIRIGIHTGPVVVGVIGQGLRTDYIASGNTTSVAARLLNFARPGQIVISAATRDATEGAFAFNDLGGVVVDGKAEVVGAYAVTCEIGGRDDAYLHYLIEA
jgi:class 3 adenylate cyclase